MINLLEEMLFCELLLNCETTGCYAMFEPDEPPHEPMEEWSKRGAAKAVAAGWAIGRTGLVKCPACMAAGT
jgi:hypothetical protein